VLDPFAGSGTTGKVAVEFGRRAVLIELNPDYVELARIRTYVTPGMF
jgi:DNA modification methylase